MLIDGEKWACEACVRGHRVSSCRHQDRPLIRINKKGRPFSVCSICRGPCKDREEHSKLNRDRKSDGESDAKPSAKKSSAQRRRPPPTSFARIAPQPARLPSSTEQEHSSSSSPPPLPPLSPHLHPRPHPISHLPHSHNQDSRYHLYSVSSSVNSGSSPVGGSPPADLPVSSSPSFDFSQFPISSLSYAGHPSLMAVPVCTMAMGYPYVTLAAVEAPIPPPHSSYPFPMTNDTPLSVPAHPSLSDIPCSQEVYDPTLSWFEDLDALPEDWSAYLWS